MSARIPSTQGYNTLHMWDFNDLRPTVTQPEVCVDKNSATDYIFKHPEMTKFSAIISNAGMFGEMSQPQFNSTMFVPLDKYLHDSLEVYQNMDRGTARSILNVSMLNNKINGDLIKSSPVSSYTTKDPYNPNYMYVTNISGVTEINQCAKVIQYDVLLSNSILHITDNLITPNYQHFLY